MRKIVANESKPIFLGHLAENEATVVEFDVTDWEAAFGSGGQFSVWAKRNGDSSFYPCVSTYSDGKVLWQVKNNDVAVVGHGFCGLIYRFSESGNAKSVIYSTYVEEGVVGGSQAPAAWEDWVEDVLAAAQRADSAASRYPYIDSQTRHWMVWDAENEAFADTGIYAGGISPQKGVDYFTPAEIEEMIQLASANLDLSTIIAQIQESNPFHSVTDQEKSVWNDKYTKPDSGIPLSDLSSSIQLSLHHADTALQSESDPTVPSWAKQTNKPAYTAQEVGALASDTQFVAPSELTAVTAKIPAQASSSNQLADKDFVNSSIQTATANFRGNWATWAEVPTDGRSYPIDYAGTRTPTTNDYMVIVDASDVPYTDPDTQEVTYPYEGTWRFKYGGLWTTDNIGGWHAEYQVNETPMTAAQLAALNSGITAALVAQISAPIQRQSGTLLAGSTNAVISFTGVPVSITVKDSSTGEEVLTDICYAANSVTISIAEAYTNDLAITVAYSAS